MRANGGDIMLENVECGDEDAEVTVDARSQHRNGGDISIQFAPRCTSVLVYTNNEGSIKARVPSGFRCSNNQQTKSSFPRINVL